MATQNIPFHEDIDALHDKLCRVRQIGQERRHIALVILADEMLAVLPRMRRRFKPPAYFRAIQAMRKVKFIPPGRKRKGATVNA